MKLFPPRRGAALLGILGAVAAGMLAASPSASAADFPPTIGTQPGHLTITPTSGNMTTNPLGTWSTDTPCLTGFQDTANVNIVTITPGSNPPEFNVATASGRVSVNGSTPPTGSFNSSMADLVNAQGLQSGQIYEVVVRCLSADLDQREVQSGFIQIAADGNGRGATDRLAEKNAAVCALTAPAWSNNSRSPSRASVACPRPLMNSPQTRWRG